CMDLPRQDLQKWNGMLFNGGREIARDLARLGVAKELDFEGYMLDKVEVIEYPFNWKTFIEVYLEDYHVGPFHPGLGQFVTTDNLRWQFSDRYSVQTVGVNNALAKPGTKAYERWHKAVLEYYRGEVPRHGAIWVTIYPNIMLEWYAHVLIVSTVIPRTVERTTTSSSSTIPRTSRCSSANSSRPSRRRTWRPRPRTTKSPSAWTRAG